MSNILFRLWRIHKFWCCSLLCFLQVRKFKNIFQFDKDQNSKMWDLDKLFLVVVFKILIVDWIDYNLVFILTVENLKLNPVNTFYVLLKIKIIILIIMIMWVAFVNSPPCYSTKIKIWRHAEIIYKKIWRKGLDFFQWRICKKHPWLLLNLQFETN